MDGSSFSGTHHTEKARLNRLPQPKTSLGAISLQQYERRHCHASYKRLESGTFERIESGDRPAVKIDAAELAMLLSGIDIRSARRRKRFRKAG